MFEFFLCGYFDWLSMNETIVSEPAECRDSNDNSSMCHSKTNVGGDHTLEADTSSGFHLIEIHLPTVGVASGFSAIVLLVGAAIIYWCCQCRKGRRSTPAPAPPVVIMPPMPMTTLRHPALDQPGMLPPPSTSMPTLTNESETTDQTIDAVVNEPDLGRLNHMRKSLRLKFRKNRDQVEIQDVTNHHDGQLHM